MLTMGCFARPGPWNASIGRSHQDIDDFISHAVLSAVYGARASRASVFCKRHSSFGFRSALDGGVDDGGLRVLLKLASEPRIREMSESHLAHTDCRGGRRPVASTDGQISGRRRGEMR